MHLINQYIRDFQKHEQLVHTYDENEIINELAAKFYDQFDVCLADFPAFIQKNYQYPKLIMYIYSCTDQNSLKLFPVEVVKEVDAYFMNCILLAFDIRHGSSKIENIEFLINFLQHLEKCKITISTDYACAINSLISIYNRPHQKIWYGRKKQQYIIAKFLLWKLAFDIHSQYYCSHAIDNYVSIMKNYDLLPIKYQTFIEQAYLSYLLHIQNHYYSYAHIKDSTYRRIKDAINTTNNIFQNDVLNSCLMLNELRKA